MNNLSIRIEWKLKYGILAQKMREKKNLTVLHDELRNNFFAISMPQSCETATKD